MDVTAVKARVDALLQEAARPAGTELIASLLTGTTTVMQVIYGRNSSQEQDLRTTIKRIGDTSPHHSGTYVNACVASIKGSLGAMKAELEAGFLGSLAGRITGDVLTDLVKLAREVLDAKSDEATNVASVLAAAAFEDTLRRLATLKGLPHNDKLADTVTALKDAGVLQGAQVGIAQSYLAFRNRALHAKWHEIDRPEVSSALAFTEELLLRHFG